MKSRYMNGCSYISVFLKEKAMAKGKKMGRPKLKRNKKAKATAMLYEKNLSIDQIQEQLGIRSKSTVYRYLRMEGFEPTRKIYLRKTKKS